MNRRGAVLGLGGVVAAAAGAGAWVWSPVGHDADVAGGADPWTMSFAAPDGSIVAMSALVGRPLLLNFWATWCGPCATEMPLIDRFSRSPQAAGWNVVAVAVDDAEPVRRFVAQRSLSLRVVLAGISGLDLSRQLGNTAGALPFTVVFDRHGQPVERKLGILDEALIDGWSRTIR